MKSISSYSNSIAYDKDHNLLYIIKNYYPATKRTSLIKREQQDNVGFSNLFIWKINEQQKSKLFSDKVAQEEQIQKIIFEKDYNEKEQQIVFNTDMHLLNYKEIPFRHPKNHLLVETYHKDSETHHLWLSNKQGQNLKQIATLISGTQWHLDVGNSMIRILKHSNRDVEIQEIAW